jgi:hypothetical protein
VSGLWTPVARLADAMERLAACVGSVSLGAAVLEPRDLPVRLAQIDRARLCPMDLTSDPTPGPALLHRPEDDGAFWMLAEPLLRGAVLRCRTGTSEPCSGDARTGVRRQGSHPWLAQVVAIDTGYLANCRKNAVTLRASSAITRAAIRSLSLSDRTTSLSLLYWQCEGCGLVWVRERTQR